MYMYTYSAYGQSPFQPNFTVCKSEGGTANCPSEYVKEFGQYSVEDPRNPLGWRAVRKHIEDSVERDFLRRGGGQESGILDRGFRPTRRGPGVFSRIGKMFHRPKSASYFDQPTAFTRPGFIKPGKIERPGFISGWD